MRLARLRAASFWTPKAFPLDNIQMLEHYKRGVDKKFFMANLELFFCRINTSLAASAASEDHTAEHHRLV